MSLLLTMMNDMREQTNIDKNEIRISQTGAMDLFKVQGSSPTGVLTPSLVSKARTSIGRVLKTPVLKFDGTLTVGSSRTLTIPVSANNSDMVEVTFNTYTFGFTQAPVEFLNNEIGRQRDFNHKMKGFLDVLSRKLDVDALAVLEANKTSIIGDDLGYTVAANTVQATAGQGEYLLNDIAIMQESNDFYGMHDILGNNGMKSQIAKMEEYGAANEKNKQAQYGDKRLFFSNRLQNGAGASATLYAIQKDQLGLLFRFEREALAGTEARTGHRWDIDELPILGIPCGTYEYQTVSDQTALGGAATADMDRVVTDHYGFAVDVAFFKFYNSDPTTIPTPIIKGEIMA